MRIVSLGSPRNASENLAIEETLLRETTEDIFMLWQDLPSIIVGRNQSVPKEIDVDFVATHAIPIRRRLSGGGAVYHDEGNLCFSYLCCDPDALATDYSRFMHPIVKVLCDLGVPAQAQGRNDITVHGQKVSGNARYALQNKLCHHGTLLFATDLLMLTKALNPDPSKIQGKGIPSVAARVVNLAQYLPNMQVQGLALAIQHAFLQEPNATLWEIPKDTLARAKKCALDRYESFAWNIGNTPPYSYQASDRFPAGCITLSLQIDHGVIQQAAIYGDFLAMHDIAPLLHAMVGVRHQRAALASVLSSIDVPYYLGGITHDELLTLC